MPKIAPEEDPLEKQKHNHQAINIIKELYSVNEETATELWHRFIDTVRKMKEIAETGQS